MAVGVIFSFLAPGFTPDLSAYLFGNILTITPTDIYLLAGISVALTALFGVFLKPIMYVAFDREYARSQRIPVTFIEYFMMMCVALTIVACLRMVGIVLAISLLTLPQMTANLITRDFRRIILWSIVIGFMSCLGGLWLSYTLQVPSGAAIIFFSILVYAFAKVVKSIYLCRRKHVA
jgi:zinc transport system permease protein